MDLGFVFSNICVLLFVVLFTGGDEASCPCPAIPPKNLTKTPPKECFKITARYRYTCIEGYVRKAGTSDLTRCQQTTDGAAKWSISSLECIRDPKLPPIITTTTTTTTIRTTTKEPVKSDSTIPQLTSTKKPETRPVHIGCHPLLLDALPDCCVHLESRPGEPSPGDNTSGSPTSSQGVLRYRPAGRGRSNVHCSRHHPASRRQASPSLFTST
ncbi:uncharacterized protein KZ484_020193 isoform 5-T5 [Pholidichthys leucotaenia]